MSALSRRDTLLALLVILIWGAHFAVIKAAVVEIGPMLSLALRFGLTALIFLPFMRWPGGDGFRRMAEIGILMGVLHQGLLFMALQRLDSSSVAVLLQSQTIFAVLMGWFFLGETFGWRTALGLGLGAAGLVVMMGVPDVAGNPVGFTFAIVSAFVLAFSYIRMRQLSKVHGPTFIAVVNGVSFPFVALGCFLIDGVDVIEAAVFRANWYIVAGVLVYQLVLVSLSHTLWQQLLARNEVARVTCFTLLMPVVAIFISIAFLGLTPSWPLLAGSGLVMAGLGVVVIRRVQKKREQPVVIVE